MTKLTPAELHELSIALRRGRAEITNRIHGTKPLAASMMVCADILEQHPDCLRSTLVWKVLSWCWRMQPNGVRRLLDQAGVWGDYQLVGDLTDRQVAALVEALRDPSCQRKEAA